MFVLYVLYRMFVLYVLYRMFVLYVLYRILSYIQDEQGKKTDVYQIKYILPEPMKKKDKSKDGKKAKTDDYESYKDSIKDSKIAWLSKLPADSIQTKVNFL